MFTVWVDSEVTLIVFRIGPSVIVDGRDVTGATDESSPATEVALAPVIELIAVGLPAEERLADALEGAVKDAEMLLDDPELNPMELLLADLELGKRLTLLRGAPGLEGALISELSVGDALVGVSLLRDEGVIIPTA